MALPSRTAGCALPAYIKGGIGEASVVRTGTEFVPPVICLEALFCQVRMP